VVLLNSTQKEIVQTIVETNSSRTDEKSKYLTQRAGKFLKILWKAEKYNDAFFEKPVIVKTERELPNYASPIHNFKKHHKLTLNNSFGSLSNKTDRSKSGNSSKGRSPQIVNQLGLKVEKKGVGSANSSRAKRFQSQDQKFDKIRLSPRGKRGR
jgi:hypothetical protein